MASKSSLNYSPNSNALTTLTHSSTASEILRSLRTEAIRLKTIELLGAESGEYIGAGDLMVNFDTALLHLDTTRESWFGRDLLSWSRLLEALSRESKRRSVHRILFIPAPSELSAMPHIQHLKHAQAIQLTLHIQMWFGNVCHVVPVSRKRLREVSFKWYSFLKNSSVMFKAPGFYYPSFSGIEVLREVKDTIPRIKYMATMLPPPRSVVTLYYLSEHFYKGRIRASSWKCIKRLMHMLYPLCLAPGCRSKNRPEIDHIFPIGPQADEMAGLANSTLINLRALCPYCNRTRPKTGSDYNPYNRFFSEIVPRELQANELYTIMTRRPPWLGSALDTDRDASFNRLFELRK
jgi:hypothetical protein